MPDTVDKSRYEAPLAALIVAAEWTETATKSAKLRAARKKALAALESRQREFNAIYERAVAPDSGWREITQTASMICEWGRAATEKLRPQIDALQRKLAQSDMPPEVRRMREQSVTLAESWLALYRELNTKLLQLAAKRQPPADVLRARPVDGEIDHERLTKDI